MIEFVFSLGTPCYLRTEPAEQLLPTCYIVGLLDKTVQIRANGLLKTLRARFYP